MSHASSNASLAFDIVNAIRHQTLASLASMSPEECDPWDEGEGGVAWLENEIGFASELVKILYDFEEPCMSAMETVSDVQSYLATLPVLPLKALYLIAITLCGTSSDELFALRERTRERPYTAKMVWQALNKIKHSQM